MKYERLTKRLPNGGVKIENKTQWAVLYPENYTGYDIDAKMMLRLAELEDKIEDGTLVELPFAIGTIVYVIYNNWETDELDIRITDIVGYEIMRDELWVKTSIPYRKSYIEVDRVFLTKDEAEKRLKELIGVKIEHSDGLVDLLNSEIEELRGEV